MEKNSFKLPAGITIANINMWKQTYRKLLIITVDEEQTPDFKVEDGELIITEAEKKEVETYVAIFREPEMGLLGEVEKKYGKDNMGSLKLLFNGCKLAVDEQIMQSTSLYLSVAKDLQKLTEQKKTNFQIF